MSADAARAMVAEALELAYRLPGLWRRVLDGQLLVWKARQVAARTLCLSTTAVAFVHSQLQAVPGHDGVTMLDRLVEAALELHDPPRRSCAGGGRRPATSGCTTPVTVGSA